MYKKDIFFHSIVFQFLNIYKPFLWLILKSKLDRYSEFYILLRTLNFTSGALPQCREHM